MPPERDAANFDFRIVALLTAMITRPDLLQEYLTDGTRDSEGRPVALTDDSKWPRLRGFGFPTEMLAEMLWLFEKNDQKPAMQPADDHQMVMTGSIQAAAADIHGALVTVQRLFRTMVAIDFYCPDDCPEDEWFMDFVPYAGITIQSLGPAGVQEQE